MNMLVAETWLALRNVGVTNERLQEAELVSTLFLIMIILSPTMQQCSIFAFQDI
jgi:hypothetical protein